MTSQRHGTPSKTDNSAEYDTHSREASPDDFVEEHDRFLAQCSPGKFSEGFGDGGHRGHLIVRPPCRPRGARAARFSGGVT